MIRRGAVGQVSVHALELRVWRGTAQRMDDGGKQIHNGPALVVGEVETSGGPQAIEDTGVKLLGVCHAEEDRIGRTRRQPALTHQEQNLG